MASEQQRGLILIPNITGFVEFIAEVSLSHGEHIISELTERLIEANRLNLQLSELDGQALFFYRQGEAPDFAELMEQIVHWSERFHSHLNLIRQDVFCKCGACQNVQGLGLHVDRPLR